MRVLETKSCRSAKCISGRPSKNLSAIPIRTAAPGVGNEFIVPQMTVIEAGQPMCRERLGGLLTFYYREVA